ncbi:unnamed protein product, partial [Clonostachys chloroleuca]
HQASSTSTTTPGKHAFTQRVQDVRCPKSDINALILDYLTMEGYSMAAAKFSKEANLQPQQDDASIRSRQEIQHYIHIGNFEAAIESLNEYDPAILDEDESLHFALLRLQLVELIRVCNGDGGDITEALKFAQEHLGPRAPVNPQFLEDLEKTMALLLIPKESLEPPLAALLDPSIRRETADRVNRAIMERQSRRVIAGIRNLVKMRCWAENTARDSGIPLPDNIDIGLHGDDSDSLSNSLTHSENGRHFDNGTHHENGHEPMITT